MNQKKKDARVSKIDICLIVLTAMFIIMINTFSVTRFSYVQEVTHDTLFFNTDAPEHDEVFQQEILKYRPSLYKRFEIYDENLKLMMHVIFDKEDEAFDIHAYPELVNLLMTSDEGQTSIIHDNYEKYIYFKWAITPMNTRRLILLYSRVEVLDDIWIFQVMCIILMILYAIQVVRIHWHRYVSSLDQYGQLFDIASNKRIMK